MDWHHRRKCTTSSMHLAEMLEARRMLAMTHLYTFNGNANDSVGNAHATLFNGAKINSGRLILQNAGLTSASVSVQYARLPNGVLPSAGSATVEVWYNTYSATPSWMRVFDFGDQTGSNGNSYLFFTPKGSTGNARAGIKQSGVTERGLNSDSRANHGYMHMAAVVVDNAAGLLRLYVDGVDKGSVALNGTTIGSVNELNAYLGRSQFNSDSGFSGSIDELRIYDEALSAATIADHYAAGPQLETPVTSTRQMENLDRGVVAVSKGSGQVYVGWRLLGTDPASVQFNLYRVTGNGAPSKRNASPITATTDFLDTGVDLTQPNRYYVRPIVGGVEQAPSSSFTLGANPNWSQYLRIPLQIPPGGTLPDGMTYTYSNYEASVGDLDGDGQYEIITNWLPNNAGASGYRGTLILDAYRMDGTLLWRIDLGKNFQIDTIDGFVVYDLDGDGKAEVVSRTADGTVSGTGQIVGDPNADYRNPSAWPEGWIQTGPEYLTVFNGETGAVRTTIPFKPALGALTQWGDNYGQRGHQIFGAIAYLDGQKPSLVYARGIYHAQAAYPQAQTQMVAWDLVNGQLVEKWHFKAGLGINNDINSNFVGQGNHQINVADVDADGKDEIINGSMVVDDDGTPLASSMLEHGDAMHVSDLNPNRPGLEVFGIHENEGTYDPNRPYGAAMYDPRTGVTLWGTGAGIDVGRGNAADIDPTRPGAESWGGPPIDDPFGAEVVRDVNGQTITNGSGTPLAVPKTGSFTHNNFLIWWDGDITRELLDRSFVVKWDWITGGATRLLEAQNIGTNQSTKQFPALSGDLIGDWREEVMWRASDSSELRIYTTTIPAQQRLYTLMHDSQYRTSIAWQNNAYNQPPHTSYFIGAGMAAISQPNISVVQNNDAVLPAPSGVSAKVVSPTQIQVKWNPVPGATGYRLKRSDDPGNPFLTIGNKLTETYFIDDQAERGGAYYYVVVALNGVREGAASLEASASIALPPPWTTQDVGTVATAGRATIASDIFSVRGGAAISGDGLRMVSQSVAGDAELVVRVDSKNNRTGAAGLTFRKSTANNAAFASITAEPTDNDRIFFRSRATDGGSASFSVAYNALPVWLKLTRSGSVFTGYYSTDGTIWTQVGNRTITMGTTVPAGMMVNGSTAETTTAKLSNFRITTGSNPAPQVLQGGYNWETLSHTLDFSFNKDVSAQPGDIAVAQVGGGAVTPAGFVYGSSTYLASLTLPPLPDGNYRATISTLNGVPLGTPYQYNFYFLAGDANRDRKVNTLDFNLLAPHFGGTNRVFSQGDFNGDGVVNSTDFNLFSGQYGKQVPAPAAPLESLALAGSGLFSSQELSDKVDFPL